MPEIYLKTVFDLNKFKPGTAVNITTKHASIVGFIVEATQDKLLVKTYDKEENVILSCWITVDDAIEMDLGIEVL